MSSAVVYLTNRCNIRCRHCFVGHDQHRDRAQMTTAEVQRVLSTLVGGGVTGITFLGGEVTTERADLGEILSHCDEIGADVSINTNLVAWGALEACLEHPSLTNIVVSLDGLTAPVHDAVRGKASFAKTHANLVTLLSHGRVVSGSIRVDLTFVLTKRNASQAAELPRFAHALGVKKVNLKLLQYNDRAERHRSSLAVAYADMLDACAAFYFASLMQPGLAFSLYTPPTLGAYFERLGVPASRMVNPTACGGTEVYTYVDLNGNNLPCPAMSLEENAASTLGARSPSLNLIDNDLATVRARSLFQGFDRSVANRRRTTRMWPCRTCRARDRCSPCTNEVIRGAEEGLVEICDAVRTVGDERFPGLAAELFEPDAGPTPARRSLPS